MAPRKFRWSTDGGVTWNYAEQELPYTLTVQATMTVQVEPIGNSTSVPGVVDLTLPVITSPLSATVTEGVQFTQVLTASEPVTWIKVGGPDAALFTLSGNNLTLAPKDFENPTDADANNTYSVTIRAIDASSNFVDQTITVSVTDIAEDTTAPTITSIANPTVAENAAFTWPLMANEAVTWTKVGGADQALFTLVGNTLSMTAKNFEAPADADANNSYVVQVRATDTSGNFTNQTITVGVTNIVDETAPTITSTASHSVAENEPYSATATADETVTWSKGGTDAGLVSLNTTTGAWSVSPQNFETKPAFSFTLTARDAAGNLSAPQTITLTITDVAESTPQPPAVRNYSFISGTTASLVADKPAGTASGDLLMFVTTIDIGDTAATFTPPTNSGNLVTPQNSSYINSGASTSTGVQFQAWYKIAGGSEPATYTLTRSLARIGSFWVIAISNPATVWKHLVSEKFNNAGTPNEPSFDALDPTLEPTLEIVMATWDEGKTLSVPPSGYTVDWRDLANHDALLAYRTNSTGSALATLPIDLNTGTKWGGFRMLLISPTAQADSSVNEEEEPAPDTGGGSSGYPVDPLSGDGTETITPNINFTSGKWKVTLPVNASGVESNTGDAQEIINLVGYQRPPYFDILTDGTLKLLVPTGGARTGGSNYPRSELREMNGSGSLYNWNPATGTHVLTATCKATVLPDRNAGGKGRIVIGQIHGPDDELNRLYYDNGNVYFQDDKNSVGASNYVFQLKDSGGNNPNIPLNAYFTYEIRVQNAVQTVTVTYNGTTYTAVDNLSPFWMGIGATCYFKAGNYMQVSQSTSAGTQGTGYGVMIFSAISVPSHT